MQGNTTEIDERNLLRLDALLSHGYGLSPQLVMRSKGLSIEAKALYGYLSSFAGAGDTAFPSTSRILEELDISKNRFYKIRKELVSWGFISIETTATSKVAAGEIDAATATELIAAARKDYENSRSSRRTTVRCIWQIAASCRVLSQTASISAIRTASPAI